MANNMIKDMSQEQVALLNKEKEATAKRAPHESKKGKDPINPKPQTPSNASKKSSSLKNNDSATSSTAGGASQGSKPNQQPVNFNAEVAGILKELNENQHKINERLDSLSSRMDSMTYEYPGCDYEADHYEPNDQYDNGEIENTDPDQSLEGSSVIYDTSEPPSKKQRTDSIFKNINVKFNLKEQVDSDVNEELAEFVNSAFIDGITEENQTLLVKDINRPSNCHALVKTKVNQPIWRLLKSHTQTDDSKMQAIQNNIIKAVTNFTKILNECGDDMGEAMVEMGTNALALLGQSNKLINNKRKEFHRTDLDVRYHYLTSSSLPYTADKLYGDEVNKNIKEIQDINRVGRNIGRGHSAVPRGVFRGRRPFRFAPQGRGRARGRGRGMDHTSFFSAGGSNFGAGPKNGRAGAKK